MVKDLPASRPTVLSETVELFRRPRVDLHAILLNAALVAIGWTVLPASIRNWLYDSGGPLTFVLVLLTWIVGDATATNFVGYHAAAVVPLLERQDRAGLLRYLRCHAAAKSIITGSLCAGVSVVIGVRTGRVPDGVVVGLGAFALPFALYPAVALFGVLFPYVPLPLLWRARNLRPIGGTLRWIALALVPYKVAAATVAGLIALPIAVTYWVREGQGSVHHLTTTGTVMATGAALFVTLVVGIGAAPVTAAVACRRSARLRALLTAQTAG